MLSNMHFLAVQRPGRSLCRSVPCLMSVSSVPRGAMAEVTDKLKGGEEAGTERKQSLCSERGWALEPKISESESPNSEAN